MLSFSESCCLFCCELFGFSFSREGLSISPLFASGRIIFSVPPAHPGLTFVSGVFVDSDFVRHYLPLFLGSMALLVVVIFKPTASSSIDTVFDKLSSSSRKYAYTVLRGIWALTRLAN